MTLSLVTGAAGAIGGHAARQLALRGDSVIGIGHGAIPAGLALADWINGDITADNLGVLAARHGAPDAIFHLAGGSSVGPSLAAPAEDFARTVGATVNLLEWTRQQAPQAHLVLASSAAVYGDVTPAPISDGAPRAPVSPYGAHKAMMETAAASWAGNFGLNVAVVRLFSVYGPGLRKQLVWEVLNRLARGERRLTMGGTGAETRDWLLISDAAAMLIAAAKKASPRAPLLNGCTGDALSVVDTVRALARGFGVEVDLTFDNKSRVGDPIHLVGRPSDGLAASTPPQVGLTRFAAEFAASR
jgi:UDP-glucose 4-epimerase